MTDRLEMGEHYQVETKVLKDYASCLKGQKEYLVKLYLDAMGLEIGTLNEKKLSWEGFVELNCFLKYSN